MPQKINNCASCSYIVNPVFSPAEIIAGVRSRGMLSAARIRALPPPPSVSKQFPLCILVIPSSVLSLSRQLRRCGITAQLPLPFFSFSREPSAPYWLLVHDGSRNIGKSPNGARRKLRSFERGLTLAEGIALASQYPSVVADHSIDLIAARYRNECTPTIYSWKRVVRLSAICSDVSDMMCGAPAAFKNTPVS